MAPGRSKRENLYFDVGKEGRKTGLTVAEKPKDKYGLEAIDDVFSSPHKAPSRNSHEHVTSLSSKSMDISRGSGADPTIILTERRVLKSTNSHLPPPSSKSPRKTNIGSSPRRQSSVGPTAKPRTSLGPPIRPSSVRKLNFGQTALPRPSIEHAVRSPLQNDLRRGARESSSNNQYDMEVSPEAEEYEGQIEHMDEIDEEVEALNMSDEEGDADLQLAEESIAMLNAGYDLPEHTAREADDQEEAMDEEEEEEEEEERQEEEVLDEQEVIENIDDDEPIMEMPPEVEDAEELISSPMVQKKKRVQPNAKRKPGQDRQPSTTPDESNIDPSLLETQPATKKRGRPRKSDDDAPIAASFTRKPANKTKKATQAVASTSSHITKKASSTIPIAKLKQRTSEASRPDDDSTIEQSIEHNPMPPPATKISRSKKREAAEEISDSDDQSTSSSTARKKAKKTTEKSPGNPMAAPAKRPGPRGLQLLRHTTPAEDISSVTRSGRRTIAPVAHWKLEKVDRDYDGTIVGVERLEEVNTERPKRKRGAKSKATKPELEHIAEEDDELEEWEIEGATIDGLVQEWDAETSTSSYEQVEKEIAYGRDSVVPKDVHGANFKYARIISTDFFGTGLMILPIDGFKARKNTRKMLMCFFVAEGKLQVEVGATQFIISKGGSWQVPRGNPYSLKNVGSKPAKLFFAQGSEKLYVAEAE